MDHDRNKVRCNQKTDINSPLMISHSFLLSLFVSSLRSGDKTEFINRLKTPDHINRNGRIFSRRDQIQMPMDEVPTEEVASQQQTLAVAEDPLQDMTVTCKQCE